MSSIASNQTGMAELGRRKQPRPANPQQKINPLEKCDDFDFGLLIQP
jgi:hypothetical protein